MAFFESSRAIFLFTHDLFGKLLRTFPGHVLAPIGCTRNPSNHPLSLQVCPGIAIPILDNPGTRCEHKCKAWVYAQRQIREVIVKHVLSALVGLGAATLLGAAPSVAQTTLTIATVNNPDITVKWVTLEENVLRQRVTTDIATKSGQFDVLTIGTYEVPIWAKKGWLLPLDKLGADYDV